ncbi:MAG: hypothetical protein M1819_002770 [Sarea resinae]|nr:MAG: hypothetical protein M1819_002770 [Sarea resinae]
MSSSSTNRQSSAVKGGAGAVPTPANSGEPSIGSGGRRRSSQGQGLFAGLVGQKRDPNNPSTSARRASVSDHEPKPGFIGQMWTK